MAPRLSPAPILITHGSTTVRLIPSLRAAMTLELKHGLTACYEAIAPGTYNVLADIIHAGASDPDAALSFVKACLSEHGLWGLVHYRDQISAFLVASFGISESTEIVEQPKTAKPFDWKDALTELFSIGTGWLGWTPEATWNATPAEIIHAHKGLIAKLTAIHGTSTPDDPDQKSPEEIAALVAQGRDPDFDAGAYHSLKAELRGGF